MPLVLLAFLPFNIGPVEALVIGGVALILFGRRLPEVGRQLGRGLVEFKKGLHGMQDEIDQAGHEPVDAPPPPDADAPFTDAEAVADEPEPKTGD